MEILDNYETKRTIEEVLDLETGELIDADQFFRNPESLIINIRRRQEEAINGLNKPKFVCAYCHQLVKLSGKRTERGTVSFFAHLYDSDECEIKTKGTKSQEEIQALKYSGIRESLRHIELKDRLFQALTTDKSKSMGISSAAIEKTYVSENPLLNWRRPDVYAEIGNKKVVFELQLSTTFLSVIVARDVFYKLNNTFIIWIFNFSDNEEYVNLENLMCKDIYYANKRNAFVFDEEAERLSEIEQELVLLCIWFEPLVQNGLLLKGKGIRHEKYVKLSDLSFDEFEFKLYYIDADKKFTQLQPGIIAERKKLEEEKVTWLENIEKRVIERLKQKQEQIKLEKEARAKEIQNIKQEIFQGKYNLSPVKKSGKWGYQVDNLMVIEPAYTSAGSFENEGKFAIVRKDRKFGLINRQGVEITPFIFIEIYMVFNETVIGKIAKDKWLFYNLATSQIIEYELDTLTVFDEKRQVFLGTYTDNHWKEKYKNNADEYLQYADHGLIKFNGEKILGIVYKSIRLYENDKIIAEVNGFTHTLKIEDDEIINPQYLIGEFHHSGFTKVKGEDFFHWGLIDKKGYLIFHPEFDSIEYIGNKGVLASLGSKHYIYDFSNNEKRKINYDISFVQNKGELLIFREPIIFLVTIMGYKYGIIDYDENLVIEPIYKKIWQDENGCLYCSFNNERSQKFEIVDGEIFHPIFYHRDFSQKSIIEEGLVMAFQNNKTGVVDLKLNIVIPIIYDKIELFDKNLFIVTLKNKSGLINFKGELVIAVSYDKILLSRLDLLRVSLNEKWGIINYSEETVVDFNYDKILNFFDGNTTIHKGNRESIMLRDLARCTKNNERGYLDINGNYTKQQWYYDKELKRIRR